MFIFTFIEQDILLSPNLILINIDRLILNVLILSDLEDLGIF